MSTQKPLLVIHLHQVIDIDNHLTKYLTSKDIYIKCSLGNKVLKTPAIGKMGIVDEKVTFQYGGEQMLLCELLTKKNSRQVGVSRISLQQIPTQQRAQPNGFRVLNSGRKQIASLGITLFKTDRNALATEGSNILNASIGRDGNNNENRRVSIQRRMSGTAPNNVYAPFTVNPVGLDQQRQQRQNQPAVAMQHRPSQEEVNHNNNAVAVRNEQQYPAETYAQLRAILGNISDEEANEMLEDFNGNVESCINYYFASGQHPKVVEVGPDHNNNNAVAVQNEQQFPAETYAQLRAILGNISDEEANKMLEDFNGNVESCINYYFASGQHPKVENVLVAPVVVAPPSISKPRPTAPVLPNTRSAPVLQTDRNANNTKAEVRRRALSVQKFDAGALGHLRAIVGDISDRHANELLDKAGGDVERAVNYYFANPEKYSGVPQQVKPTVAPRQTSSMQSRAREARRKPKVLPRARVIRPQAAPHRQVRSFLNNDIKYSMAGNLAPPMSPSPPPVVSGTYIRPSGIIGRPVVQAQPMAPRNAFGNNNPYNTGYNNNVNMYHNMNATGMNGRMGYMNNTSRGMMNNGRMTHHNNVMSMNNNNMTMNNTMYNPPPAPQSYSGYNKYRAAPGTTNF